MMKRFYLVRQVPVGPALLLLAMLTACTLALAPHEVTDQRQAFWIGGTLNPPIGDDGQGATPLCNSSGVFKKSCPTGCGPDYLKPKPIIPGQILRYYAETGDQACTNTPACRDLEICDTRYSTACDPQQAPQ